MVRCVQEFENNLEREICNVRNIDPERILISTFIELIEF